MKTSAEEVAQPPSVAYENNISSVNDETFARVQSPEIISIDDMDNYLSKMNDYVLYMKSLESRNKALEMENVRVNQENTQLRLEMSERGKTISLLKCSAQISLSQASSLVERVHHDLKFSMS